jgi:hypothetical protein
MTKRYVLIDDGDVDPTAVELEAGPVYVSGAVPAVPLSQMGISFTPMPHLCTPTQHLCVPNLSMAIQISGSPVQSNPGFPTSDHRLLQSPALLYRTRIIINNFEVRKK